MNWTVKLPSCSRTRLIVSPRQLAKKSQEPMKLLLHQKLPVRQREALEQTRQRLALLLPPRAPPMLLLPQRRARRPETQRQTLVLSTQKL
jgi:hypothetical protein